MPTTPNANIHPNSTEHNTLTSDGVRERQRSAYLLARAERIARRIYGVPLQKLTGPEWKGCWDRVHADERLAEGGTL